MDPTRAVPPVPRRTLVASLTLIVAAGAALRFWGLGFGLPYTNARPDESFVIDVALKFLRGDFRPAFYDYPWLYMWAVTGLYLLYFLWGMGTGAFHTLGDLLRSWPTHWAPFFLMDRALTAALGTATILVVFRLARQMWDDATALVAALFMSLAFLHVRDSHYGTTDVPMTFLIVLSLSFFVRAHQQGRRRDFALSGFVGGLAAATKYNALLLAAPVILGSLVAWRNSTQRDPQVGPVESLALYGLPFLAGLAIGIPFVLFDLPRFREAMMLLLQSMQQAGSASAAPNGYVHHLEYSLRYGLGLPLLIAGIAGSVMLAFREPRNAVFLLSFPVLYFAVAGSVRILFFRYAIPLVPFLCLAAAWVLMAVLGPACRRFAGRWQTVTPALPALCAAVLVALPSARSAVAFDRVISRTDNRVLVAEWFDRHVPPGSSVVVSGSLFGYVQFPATRRYDVWSWDRVRQVFVVRPGSRPAEGRPDWILMQESPLPSTTQPVVHQYLKHGYVLVRTFRAFARSDDAIFDQQDAFFVPFAGFGGVERPGPNFSLYKKVDAR